MKFLRRLAPRLSLAAAGLVVPLALLWAGAALLGEKPLEPWELTTLLNRQQLAYNDLDAVCRPSGDRATNGIDVFGGSSVYGSFATPGADFPRVLGRRLARRFGEKAWAVRNRAFPAKSSYWVRRCAELAVADEAKIWVIYEGHNDFIDIAGQHIELTRFFLEHPGFADALEPILATPFSATLRPFFRLRPGGPESAELRRRIARVLELSEANYRAVIALARAHGVRLVLATVVANLEIPPDPATPDEPPAASAAAAYEAGLEAYRRGDSAGGYRLLSLARDLDPRLWRAPSGFNELMRRLARENPDVVTLLDLEEAARIKFGGSPMGCRLFGQGGHCDRIHPNDFTHAWIAGELERRLFP